MAPDLLIHSGSTAPPVVLVRNNTHGGRTALPPPAGRLSHQEHPHDRILGPRHEAPVKTIAFVQYPGLTPLDIVGPLQVLSLLSHLAPGYDTVVVGERIEPMATDTPLSLVPSHTFETMPDPYALIVPGGTVPTLAAMADEKLLDKLRTAAARSEIVGSVCTGSLLLAAAGLLEGRRANSH